MSEDATPVAQVLDQLTIRYRLFSHSGPVTSLAQAARERGQQPEQIIRSLLFRLSVDEFVLVLVAGPQQINWKRLRTYFGRKRLTTASEAEVLRMTGYERGAVAPFGLAQPLRIVADAAVFRPAEISIGSGVRGTTVILTSADLRRALGEVEIAHFGDEPAL